MKSIHDSLALLWSWFLHTIGVMAQLALVDTRCPRYGGKACVSFTRTYECGSVEMIVKLVLAITQPRWHSVTVVYHTLDMKAQRLWYFNHQLVVCLCGNSHCTRYIFSKCSPKILLTPCYIYSYFLHCRIIFMFFFIF